jgi:fructokinase
MPGRCSVVLGFFGEILVDVIATPAANYSNSASVNIEARLGGAPINAAVVASQLSSEVASYPICSFGDDWLGNFLHTELKKYRVKLDTVSRIPNRNTSVAFYPLDSSGEQMWSSYHRDADLEIFSVSFPLELIHKLDGFGFGSSSLVLQLECVMHQLHSACVVGFDVNYRPAMWERFDKFVDTVSEWLHKAHMIKCNLQEAELLTGVTGDPEATLRALNVRDDQYIFLTLGRNGSMIRHGTKIIVVPTTPVDGIPIGTGDSFFAAILTGLSLSKKLNKLIDNDYSILVSVCEFANKCGGIANMHDGACSPDVTAKYIEAYETKLKRALL